MATALPVDDPIPSAPTLGEMPDEEEPPTASSSSDGASGGDRVDGAAAAAAAASSPDAARKDGEEDEEDEAQKSFECNICLDVAKDAVISLCGHLFCWPCLHQWLETRPNRQICPVCKAGISRDKVIPLYGRGSTDQKDPREKIPPRPRGQRPEPETTGMAGGFFNPFGMGAGNHNGGFQMSFGIGAFPFGFFATNFNLGDNRMGPNNNGRVPSAAQQAQLEEEQFLSRVFLWVAMAFIFWLMLA